MSVIEKSFKKDTNDVEVMRSFIDNILPSWILKVATGDAKISGLFELLKEKDEKNQKWKKKKFK